MTSVDRTVTSRASARLDPDGRAYLLVVAGDSSSLFHLPRHGTVVIGRAPDAELHIDHASVSRRHASIRVDDGVARVADLQSHNGTRVNGEVVTAGRVLSTGDVVAVGDVLLVVHTSVRPARLHTVTVEDAWRRRLAEELERALTYHRSLAVIALDVIDIPGAVAAIGPTLRLIDVVGRGDAGYLLVLLPEIERPAAIEIARRMLAALPAPARAGVAGCPVDAVDPDAILLCARAAARAAEHGAVGHPGDSATRITVGDREIVVADPAMARMFALLDRLAAATLPVLIVGETGVGKDHAASAMHHWSKRSAGPFVAVNCAALGPEALIESELFGHERGAFTGAVAAKAGLFEHAHGGTLFLDEVAELPRGAQAKLLRVLESHKVSRLGEARERPVDVRVVSATHRNLEDEVRAGRFRQDLMFRLAGATVILPPLRDRRGEIPILARELLAQACARESRPPMEITPAAMQVLLTHDWPGNVRELRNVMDRAAAAAPDCVVEPSDLPEELAGSAGVAAPAPVTLAEAAAVDPTPRADPDDRPPGTFQPIADELRALERRRMVEALAAAGGVKRRAAQLIDMPIRTFTLKAKQYGL